MDIFKKIEPTYQLRQQGGAHGEFICKNNTSTLLLIILFQYIDTNSVIVTDLEKRKIN